MHPSYADTYTVAPEVGYPIIPMPVNDKSMASEQAEILYCPCSSYMSMQLHLTNSDQNYYFLSDVPDTITYVRVEIR